MLKHYVTFLFPGSFYPEETIVQIDSRESTFDIPGNCFAYYLWDRIEVVQGDETLYGERKNKTGRFYFGEVLTIDDVKSKYPESKILISNMEMNNWKKIVRTRRGNFQPIEAADTVLTGFPDKFPS